MFVETSGMSYCFFPMVLSRESMVSREHEVFSCHIAIQTLAVTAIHISTCAKKSGQFEKSSLPVALDSLDSTGAIAVHECNIRTIFTVARER